MSEPPLRPAPFHIAPQSMHLTANTLTLAGLVSLLVSCSHQNDTNPTEPVQQASEEATLAPATTSPSQAEVNPLALFHTPKDDLKLPNDSQLKDGKASSIGTGIQPVRQPDHSPSITITPPPAPEDELDPQ
ncbi:MAG: hypothetical protein KJO21_11425 [Verrucomicrobiae bacterium]|nr:hypothetical protein [Verrucomicrobiae bacterium]NNJ42898.1 hypothetical protein [Akkermansiaceae bacterium]